MLDIVVAAGWPIYPIILCSVVALGIIGERFYTLRPSVLMPDLIPEIIEKIQSGGEFNENEIANFRSSSVMGFIIAAGIEESRLAVSDVEAAMNEAALAAAKELEKFLTTLGTIATLSPLLGLLGTIVGMIEIFGASSATGLADPAKLAHGISVALYNAAFGIIVAVPSLICYRHFRAKADTLLTDMESLGAKLQRAMKAENSI